MTNLEFINEQIAITKSKYKEHLKFNQTAFAIKDEKRLKKLQQIKTDLEAWEVVKNKGVDMIIFMLYDGNLEKYNDYVKSSLENECDYEKCLLTQDNCEKLKKALGLDNE